MAVMERLALIIDADGQGAIREMDKVGRAAERDLGRAEDKTEKLSKTFTSAGTKMMAASAVMGAGLWAAASATSDLNEQISQSEQVFGPASDAITEFAEGAAAIGQSETQARKAANTFGLFFEKASLSKDEAAEMSVTMAELASDMASFRDTTPEQAIEALGAALRGESEPIRNYGVMLDDMTLKQRAFDMGLTKSTTGTLPPAIKMQAAYAEIIEQTGTIVGDFARTSDGAANSQRIAAAEFENAKAALGEGFLPVLQEVTKAGGSLASMFAGLNESTGGFVSKAMAATTVVAGVGGAALFTAGKVMEMRKAMLAAAAAGNKMAAAMLKALGPVAIAVAGIAVAYAGWERLMQQNADAASDMGSSLDDMMLSASPEELNRKLAETNRQIGSVKEDLANSSEVAFWDADYRAGLNDLGVQLETSAHKMLYLRDTSNALAKATGNSTENTLGWLQVEAAAGRQYETSADAVKAYRKAVEVAGGSVDSMTAEELELAEQYQDSVDALDDLIEKVDEYFDAIDSNLDPLIAWEEATDGLMSTLSENGPTWDWVNGKIDINTEAGRENLAAMRESRDAAVDLGQAVLNEGGTAEAAAAKTLEHAEALKDQMRAAGYSEDAVNAYITELGLTPEQVAVAFNQPGMDAAKNNIDEYHAKLNALPPEKRIAIYTDHFASMGLWGFGGPKAAGGPVEGGKTYLVGEQGPELVTMGGAGHVTNARDTAAALSGGGDGGGWPERIVLEVDGRTLAEVAAPHLAQQRRGHHGSRRTA